MKRITRKKVVRFLFWLALAERQPLALLGRVKKLYSEKPSGIMKVRSANRTNKIPGGLLKWKKISQVCSTQHEDASIM